MVKNKKHGLTGSQKEEIAAYICLAPALIGLILVIFIPIAKSIVMSFMDYRINTTQAPKWNNFENYIHLFKEGNLGTYTYTTIIYMVLSVSLQFIIAMIIALLLNKKIAGRGAVRGLFMIPWVIPSVVTSMLWNWMFNPQYGVWNYILFQTGLQSNPNQLWVLDPKRAMICIVIATVWKNAPYMMLMILAGLQSIDLSLNEAASIDGANAWQTFRYITLPSLKNVLTTTILISLIGTAQMFTLIYNMTGGGPINKTTTFVMASYNKAFVEFNMGEGAALGVIWLILLGGIIGIYQYFSEKKSLTY